MYREKLKEKLEKIFDGMKVTYNAPSEESEQGVVFVIGEKETTRPSSDGSIYSKVQGYITIFAEYEKMPHGFVERCLAKAKRELTDDIFFYDVDEDVVTSQARTMNIAERRSRFVYLFRGQYNPPKDGFPDVTFEQVAYIDVGDGSAVVQTGDGPVIGVEQ